MAIRKAPFYGSMKRYTSARLLEVWGLPQLRDGNARLKRLVAELTSDRTCLRK